MAGRNGHRASDRYGQDRQDVGRGRGHRHDQRKRHGQNAPRRRRQARQPDHRDRLRGRTDAVEPCPGGHLQRPLRRRPGIAGEDRHRQDRKGVHHPGHRVLQGVVRRATRPAGHRRHPRRRPADGPVRQPQRQQLPLAASQRVGGRSAGGQRPVRRGRAATTRRWPKRPGPTTRCAPASPSAARCWPKANRPRR